MNPKVIERKEKTDNDSEKNIDEDEGNPKYSFSGLSFNTINHICSEGRLF